MAQGNTTPNTPSQNVVPIKDIKEGVIILKEGGYRSVISVSPVNLALKSEQEKDAVAFSYQNFLNSLEFPIQILSVSRKLDLSNYLENLKQIIANEQSPFIKIQAEEYYGFIEALLDKSNIMDKEFYVIVSFYPSTLNSGGFSLFSGKKTTSQENFEENKRALLARCEQAINGISSMGLNCKILNTEQIMDLTYVLYNPEAAANVKIGSAIGTIQGDLVTGGDQGIEGMHV
jgi:hypothetical protein